MNNTSRKFPWARGALFLILAALSVMAILKGIDMFDVEEIISNASILCLSCIGIG